MKPLRPVFKRIGAVVLLAVMTALAIRALAGMWTRGTVSVWGPVGLAVILVFLVRAVMRLFGHEFRDEQPRHRRGRDR